MVDQTKTIRVEVNKDEFKLLHDISATHKQTKSFILRTSLAVFVLIYKYLKSDSRLVVIDEFGKIQYEILIPFIH